MGTILGVFGFTITHLIYLLSLMGIERYTSQNSPKIENQSHLERIVKIEIEKMGLKDKNIKVKLSNDRGIKSNATQFKDNHYEIILSPPHNDLGVLRHELYHIADGHFLTEKEIKEIGIFEGIIYKFGYIYYREPKAAIYAFKNLER